MESFVQEFVLTSSPDGRITVYDPYSGPGIGQYYGSRTPRKGLIMVGRKLIATSHVSADTGLGLVNFYQWSYSTPSHQLPMPEPVAPLVATQDGSYLFAGGVFGNVYSISLPSGDIALSAAAHPKAITCLEINGDGSLLFSGSDDGTISVFPIHQLVALFSYKSSNLSSPLLRFIGHQSSITSIRLRTGGCNCTIISCSLDCTCKFWDLSQKTPLYSITFPCTIWEVKLDPLETEFYCAGSNGLLYKCALYVGSRKMVNQGPKLIAWKKHHDGAVISMDTMNQGKHLVTASEDGGLCVWDAEQGDLIKVLDQEKTGSISHVMALATRLNSHVSTALAGMKKNVASFGGWNFGVPGKDLCVPPITEMKEMQEHLIISGASRKRSIDTLELAVGAYERVLTLMCKEVKGSGSNKNGEDQDK